MHLRDAIYQAGGLLADAALDSAQLFRAQPDGSVRILNVNLAGALENQLMNVGGRDDSTGLTSGDALYPSIRKLPLLGVAYADLFRKTKVQEAVFETLTQEYELAKVQEVKEIPTVKLLDSPNVPERKSFPPRALITLLGTTVAFMCGVVWLFGCLRWEQTDPTNPGKVLTQEVFDTLKAAMPWASRNGSALHTSSPDPGGHVAPRGTENETGK